MGHSEMPLVGMDDAVGETLSALDVDDYQGSAFHYSRMRYISSYMHEQLCENDYVRVVVEVENGDGYVRTAQVAGRLLRGDVI